jgi:cyanoexosortase A
VNPTNYYKLLSKPDVWLGAIGVSLALIHLSMCWRMEALSYAGSSFLVWCAVASLVWDKRDSLNLKSGAFATAFAIAMLVPVLLKSIFLINLSFLCTYSFYAFPLLAGVSLALLASGFCGIGQYRRELAILLILGLTQPVVSFVNYFLSNNFDPSFLTARFSTYLLWLSGFEIVRKGVNIYFADSHQGIEVYPGCSGLDAMTHLLGLTILYFLVFPTNTRSKILLLFVAPIIGFVINGIRVALLAVIVAYHENEGFEYWHSGEGSQLFSLAGAVLLCGVALLLMGDSSKPEPTLDRVGQEINDQEDWQGF